MNKTLTEPEEKDLLSIMINTVDENTGQSFSDQLIKDSSFAFFLAGYETTATAIPIVLYHLGMVGLIYYFLLIFSIFSTIMFGALRNCFFFRKLFIRAHNPGARGDKILVYKILIFKINNFKKRFW